jgi:hypothetical protein
MLKRMVLGPYKHVQAEDGLEERRIGEADVFDLVRRKVEADRH